MSSTEITNSVIMTVGVYNIYNLHLVTESTVGTSKVQIIHTITEYNVTVDADLSTWE